MSNSLDEVYWQALVDVQTKGIETSPRGMLVKELLGYQFTIDPMKNIVTIPGFETHLKYAKLELEWYLSGTNRIDWNPTIKKIWEPYSDDGVRVNSAYGYYMFMPTVVWSWSTQAISQWQWVVEKLRSDRDSRQAVININQPSHKQGPTKDFPCTIACQVFIREDKLHWITYMRSQDLFHGTRNDVYCFTELQKKMASELEVQLGNYTHVMGSMHLYEPHWKLAAEVTK